MTNAKLIIKIFVDNVGNPAGILGLPAYVSALQGLIPEFRSQIQFDGTLSSHLKIFSTVIKLAADVNPRAFLKANVSKTTGLGQSLAVKHLALVSKLRHAIQSCMEVTEPIDEEQQIKVSALRDVVRNMGNLLHETSVIAPIMPEDTLQLKAFMLTRLCTLSTLTDDTIKYVYKPRFMSTFEDGGLSFVLKILHLSFNDKDREHLLQTFIDTLVYLDPNEDRVGDNLHELVEDGVDTMVMMVFLTRQLFLDTQGGLRRILELRNSIPITADCFLKDSKYGVDGHEANHNFRADRLPYILATALSELRAFGTSSKWSLPDVQQHMANFVAEFNTIIIPAGGQPVPSDATPESVMQDSSGWIPAYVAAATQLPQVLANTIFQQVGMLLTMYNSLKRPSPPPVERRPIPSINLSFTAEMNTPGPLLFEEDDIQRVGELASAHMGIPFPPITDEEDRADFWDRWDITIRQHKVVFPPDLEWVETSPAYAADHTAKQQFEASSVRLNTILRMTVVGATMHTATQPTVRMDTVQQVREARIALLSIYLPPKSDFARPRQPKDKQPKLPKVKKAKSPKGKAAKSPTGKAAKTPGQYFKQSGIDLHDEAIEISSSSDDESDGEARRERSRSPQPEEAQGSKATRPEKRKAASDPPSDDPSSEDSDDSPDDDKPARKAKPQNKPKRAKKKRTKTGHMARAGDFKGMFDTATISDLAAGFIENATNTAPLTTEFMNMFIATVVNGMLVDKQISKALDTASVCHTRVGITVDIWLRGAFDFLETTKADLRNQFANAMLNEDQDLTAAFEFMVNDLVGFCRDAEHSPYARPGAPATRGDSDEDEPEDEDNVRKPKAKVRGSAIHCFT